MNNTKFIGHSSDGQFKAPLKARKNPIKLNNNSIPPLLIDIQYESEV